MRYVKLLAGTIALVAAILFVPRFFLGQLSIIEVQGVPTPAQLTQISIVSEMNRTLISLSTLVIGSVGILLLHFNKIGIVEPADKALGLFTFLCAGTSISLGYTSYEVLNWMLDMGFFNLDSGIVKWSSQFQYYSFALAVAGLVAFLLNGIRRV